MPRGGKRTGAGRPPLGEKRLIPIEIRLTREIIDRFTAAAEKLGIPRSQLMREVLDKHKPRKPRSR